MDKDLKERMEELSARNDERQEKARREVWKHPKPLREWTAHGLRCFMLSGVVGGPNGYAVVPPEHPWYAVHYSECPKSECDEEWCEHTPESGIEVHGGITLSALVKDGWAFGFDTAHVGDQLAMGASGLVPGTVWELGNVATETEHMAKQLSEVV